MSLRDEMKKYLQDLENDPSLIYDSYFMCSLSKFSMLPYNIIEKYVDYVDWYEICLYRHMSIDFMEKMNKYLRFDIISRTQRLTEKFIEKYKDKLEWSSICGTQKLSEKFLLEHFEDIVLEPLLYNKKAEITDNFWRTLFTYNDSIEVNGRWMPNNFCKPFSVNLVREFRNKFKYLNGKMINSRDQRLWKELRIATWK